GHSVSRKKLRFETRVTIPDYPTLFWISAILALLLVGIGKAGFGGGVGLVATPLMALTIPVADAAALLLPLLIIMDMFSIYHYYGEYDRTSIRLLLPAAVVGIAIGGLFFGYFSHNERIMRVGIGVVALLFVLYQLGKAVIVGALTGSRPPAWLGMLLGGMAGFTSTLAHAGGPPVAIYLIPQRLPRQTFVGTTVVLFTLINLIKLIPYGYLGLLRVGNLTTILILAPICFLGVRLGIFLNGKVNETWFNRVVYTLLFLTGLELVSGQSLLGLLQNF
ncbi:MAG: sulfite exporter TauE/SafE family protein, partial [Caldilineaceae bacterium]|nr:sulfite exporter TauE/SafE family protein [Caldilineaceae bacterium]